MNELDRKLEQWKAVTAKLEAPRSLMVVPPGAPGLPVAKIVIPLGLVLAVAGFVYL